MEREEVVMECWIDSNSLYYALGEEATSTSTPPLMLISAYTWSSTQLNKSIALTIC